MKNESVFQIWIIKTNDRALLLYVWNASVNIVVSIQMLEQDIFEAVSGKVILDQNSLMLAPAKGLFVLQKMNDVILWVFAEDLPVEMVHVFFYIHKNEILYDHSQIK